MKDKHPRLGAQLIPSTKCENPFKSRDVIIKMIPGRDGRSHRERSQKSKAKWPQTLSSNL